MNERLQNMWWSVRHPRVWRDLGFTDLTGYLLLKLGARLYMGKTHPDSTGRVESGPWQIRIERRA